MVSFLIALFLIGFVIIKWVEKDSYDQHLKNEMWFTENKVRFISTTYTDRELEQVIREALDNPRYNRDIQEELRGIFNHIPVCRGMNFNHRSMGGKNNMCSEMAVRLLLAHRGKMMCGEAIDSVYGMRNNRMGIVLPNQLSEYHRLMRRRFRHMLLWVEAELQRHGVPAELYLNHGNRAVTNERMVVRAKDYECPTDYGAMFDEVSYHYWKV